MAFTFGNIAKVSTTMAMAGNNMNKPNSLISSPRSKEENQALAIGKVAESNIIQPKNNKAGIGLLGRKKKGLGLSLGTYNQLGKMGQMTARTQVGASLPRSGGLVSKKI